MKKNIKKLVIALLVAVMLLSVFTACGSKKIEGSEGLEYTLSDDGKYYVWTGIGTCTDSEIVIGNWHNDRPVTACGEIPNMPAEGITKITVSNGITTLAFGSLCSKSVKKIVICDGIEVLPKAVMLMTPEMTEVVLGKGIKTIELDAFMRAVKLETVYFRGSEKEWNEIDIDEKGNEYLLNAKIVFNYKGE